MIKRIYTVLFSSAFIAFSAVYSAPSNVKKIINKNGKVIVIIRENGKDKEIVLDKNMLNKITSENSKQNRKKSTKVTKKDKNSKKNNKKTKVTSFKNKKTNKYIVKKGDTIFSIAKMFKVSISNLVKLNKLNSSKLIHPGDVLKIPAKGYLEAAEKAVKTNKKRIYIVKRGDTLNSIAKKFNMKISELRKLNNFIPHPKLKPGMEVNVIGKEKVTKTKKIVTKYVVKRGDTLWSIARKYNLTVSQLRLLNPTIRTKGLRRGAVLNVSKAKAIKIAKYRRKRKSRLSGLLSKYRKGNYSNNRVVAYAKRFLGVRYRWGATGNGGFDCSGFTQYVMRHAKGRIIPRVSRRQAYYGKYVSRRNLRPGDLIFFDTSRSRRGYVNHVGIYIGNGYFIHASSGKHRVVITSLNKPFYRSRFMWGRRIN